MSRIKVNNPEDLKAIDLDAVDPDLSTDIRELLDILDANIEKHPKACKVILMRLFAALPQ